MKHCLIRGCFGIIILIGTFNNERNMKIQALIYLMNATLALGTLHLHADPNDLSLAKSQYELDLKRFAR